MTQPMLNKDWGEVHDGERKMEKLKASAQFLGLYGREELIGPLLVHQ